MDEPDEARGDADLCDAAGGPTDDDRPREAEGATCGDDRLCVDALCIDGRDWRDGAPVDDERVGRGADAAPPPRPRD